MVVPAYQAAATLDLALASVAGQEQPAYDVVLVDDASTDGTADLAARWAATLPLRIVRHDRNRGQAAALRSGIEAARSPLVARLDADDVWLPDHLAMLGGLFQVNGGLVTANSWNWVPGQALAEASWYEKHPVPPAGHELVELARRNWVFGAFLLDRDGHDRVGGFRDLPACEDWDLWLRMLDAGVPVTTAPNVTMLYRQRLGTVSRGERSLRASATLLRDFSANGRHPDARRVAARTAREMDRRAHLHRSYELARGGAPVRARARAGRALLGRPRTSARAAAVLLAPAASVRLYDRLQSDARRRTAA